MTGFWKSALPIVAIAAFLSPVKAKATADWTQVDLNNIADDDIGRHRHEPNYLDAIDVTELRFSENGFNWHLIRFVSSAKPTGPLWMVPHDDENAGFESMIMALRKHGGVGIAVNSGPGSLRVQSGNGVCGVKSRKVKACDPNRNFYSTSPLFAAAFLDQRVPGQPIIALHTNSRGFDGDGQGGRGQITILDAAKHRRGAVAPRSGGHFAINPKPAMADYDTLGLTAYLARNQSPDAVAVTCRKAFTKAGVHFWHERVGASDGSMSNYLALNKPDIAYFNAESRIEPDLAVAAMRHDIMVDAYIAGCLGNQPVR